MKKLFLLSVLFIFMGNVSANYDSKAIEVIDKDALGGIPVMITVYCIADYVFVTNREGDFTQVNKKVGRDSVPMTCNEYR